MTKTPYLLAMVFLFGAEQTSLAQTFINNNTVVESRVVSPQLFSFGEAGNPQSIACGQYGDDNGDGQVNEADFADCAALQERALPIGSPEPEPGICVLLNTAIQNNSPNQFNDGYAQQTAASISGFSTHMGSIRSGALDGSGGEDLVALVAGDDPASFAVELVLRSIANADFTTNSGVDCTVDTPAVGTSSEATWRLNSNELATFQGDGERGMELFDCDGDGDLDSVTASSNNFGQSPSIFINVNINNGSGLQDILANGQFDTTLLPGTDDFIPTVLDTADFNGDGLLDVAAANNGDDTDSLAICYADPSSGACSYVCNTQVDLDTLTGFDAGPTSLAAADFDGDGGPDVAIVLSESGTLGYFFNNQSAAAAGPNFTAASSLQIGTQAGLNALPYAVTSGFFNLDDVPDAAVTNFVDPASGTSTVGVILSDGSNGFLPLELLQFPAPDLGVTSFGYVAADGIEAQDFDHCGGDDIVALVYNLQVVGDGADEGFKEAAFWYNADEAPIATALSPLTGETDTPIAVAATCSDPTDDDRSFTWTIVGPAGSNSSITPASGALMGTAEAIAGSFQGDTLGDYTLTLNCSSCDLSATATVQITLSQSVNLTQGGCLASLSAQSPGRGNQLIWGMIALLPFLYLMKRSAKPTA